MSDEAMLMDLGIEVDREKYERERNRCAHCGCPCGEGATYDEDLCERVCRACEAERNLASLEEEQEEPEESSEALVQGDRRHVASPGQLVSYAALFFVGFGGLVHTFVHPSIVVTVAVALAVAAFGTYRVHHAHALAS